jgi:hypothetical protein
LLRKMGQRFDCPHAMHQPPGARASVFWTAGAER